MGRFTKIFLNVSSFWTPKIQVLKAQMSVVMVTGKNIGKMANMDVMVSTKVTSKPRCKHSKPGKTTCPKMNGKRRKKNGKPRNNGGKLRNKNGKKETKIRRKLVVGPRNKNGSRTKLNPKFKSRLTEPLLKPFPKLLFRLLKSSMPIKLTFQMISPKWREFKRPKNQVLPFTLVMSVTVVESVPLSVTFTNAPS